MVLIKADISFGNGLLEEADHSYQEALERAVGANFRNILYAASLGLAQVTQALGEKEKAENLLEKYLPLFKKYRLENETNKKESPLIPAGH